MQKSTLTALIGGVVVLAGAGLLLPDLLSEPVPVGRWQAKDEIEVPAEPAQLVNGGDESNAGLERSAADTGNQAGADERIEVVLRGRVIDKFKAPIAQATVWLDYGRGGPRGGGRNDANRRVPDPVRTDAEGRFAFQGETFRNLRVSLQVAHDNFAAAQFDKDVGRVAKQKQALDLGDLVLMAGGEVRGRVTDLEGNGVPDAQMRVQPENENPLRFLRDRERLLPPFVTDQNGYFRRQHLAGGDWSVTATAKKHTEGRSPTFAIEEEQATDIEDIRLGPGFELAGTVHNVRGEPIAKADVVLTSEARRAGRGGGPGGGGGGPGGGAREHRTTTDAQGRFFLEHLPGTTMRLQADADGYLNTRVDGIDPALGQPIAVTMADGLRIEGRVRDGAGAAVTLFAVRAVRIRGLQADGQANVDFADMMNRMRDTNLSEDVRGQLRMAAEEMRTRMVDVQGRRGGDNGGGRGGGGPGERVANAFGRGRDTDKPEQHPDGTFVATGLQEGVYEVYVQSPEHARYRSAEVELRSGGVPPKLEVVLDAGVFVAGTVVDTDGAPVRGATVELRMPPPEGMTRGRGRNGGNGANAGNNAGNGGADAATQFATAAREAMRFMAAGPSILDAKTDARGAFVIKHVPRGTYQLQADARGLANASTESFDLQADRSDFELRLAKLGTIAGSVSGLQPEEIADAHVGAVPIGNGGGLGALFGRGGRGGGNGGGGPFNSVQVAADGTYRIEELAAGDYVVRAWIGSPQDLMRELGPRFGDGTLHADATVAAGKETKLDVAVTRPQVGTVEGTVLNNGDPATGWTVELVQRDDNTSGNPGGGQGRGRWMFGGSHRATVATSGRFSIAKVPAGDYTLRVQGAQGGRNAQAQGRAVVYEEPVNVLTGSTVERSISVVTHSLQGTVTRDDGGNAAELGGRVQLLAGVTAMPENLQTWTRENGDSTITTAVRSGAFRFDTLKPGSYLLVLSLQGRERTSTQVSVQGDQSVTMAAGKTNTQPPGNAPAARPNGQPAANAPGSAPGSAPSAPPSTPPRTTPSNTPRTNRAPR